MKFISLDELSGFNDPAMVIVTAAAGSERAGCLVGFSAQCSIDPPRYLVCISVENRTYEVASRAAVLAVHAVRSDQFALAEHFGGETGDDVDKFAAMSWHAGPSGVSVLDECAVFVGRIVDVVEFGDHTGFILAPLDDTRGSVEGEPLRLSRAQNIDPGHPA